MTADSNRNAANLKPKLGQHAYRIQSIIEMTKKRGALLDISMDKESIRVLDSNFKNQNLTDFNYMTKVEDNASANIILVMNGKVCGGR